MEILAHRGWWLQPEEKNTITAFKRALSAGYGIETDLRDCGGEVVISHDMPKGDGLLSFDDFLALYVEIGAEGTLALNIKADGLHVPVFESLKKHEVKRAFVFDMAVPDSLGYMRSGVKTFTRHSEYEPTPPFYEMAGGVWIDCFESDWITQDVIKGHLGAGKAVALVSPELHKRDHLETWEAWGGLRHPDLYLCTDFPDRAETFFSDNSI